MNTVLRSGRSISGLSTLVFTTVAMLLTWMHPAFAQGASNSFWSDASEMSIPDRAERQTIPERYRTVAFDTDALRLQLSQAPAERSAEARRSPLILNLPMPDGTSGDFTVEESPIMEPELAAKFPWIRTYIARGISEPTASARLDWTQFGFHAIIFSIHGTVYIDPYNRATTTHYISYFKKDLIPTESHIMREEGPLDTDSEIAADIRRIVASGVTRSTGEELRTYRLAVAATGEYTAFHGGTVPAGMAAIVTAINRVTGIYEREVSVRMVLVANNDLIVYTNASTDPYTNNNGSTMLGQNQTNLDAVIGNANYDIGHVFSTGGGGVANLGVPCRAGLKARGVTGLPSPIGDPFYVDYVAHEMGHQYGANHSFNGSTGSCSGGNRNAGTAYEPGSGSTIMAYAGICGNQNIQNASDDYFHLVSIEEIVAYTQFSAGNSCPVVTPTGNDPPFAGAGTVIYTIPLGTPFILTGGGLDFNGDPLTYCWEQFDLGPAGHPNSPSGNAPIFRSFSPTTSPSRMFPRLTDILNNTQTIGEILPSYARTLTFRLTVRDNAPGGGGYATDQTSVVVTGSAGPFQVTRPNTSLSWIANTADSVTWDVANTSGPAVNCSLVNILLSTDGGLTFPDTLVSNTPNDGREAFTVPAGFTATARIKIEAVGNIFFDISNTNFTITPLVEPSLAFPADSATGVSSSLSFRWNPVQLATTYHLQVARNPGFAINVVLNDSTLTDTTRALAGLLNGTIYYWRVRAKNPDGVSAWSTIRSFTTLAAPAQVTLVAPTNQAVIGVDSVEFRWNRQAVAETYWLEYSSDSTFSVSLIDSTLTDTTLVARQLQSDQAYWWRARAKNSLGWGPFSAVRKFTVLITSVTEGVGLPGEFSLEQNFPNPFNPSTVIRFGLPQQAHVKLEIFNTLGQRVAVLADETYAAGFQSVSFNAAGLTSGVYVYRLTAGDFVETRKLLLLK